MKSDELRKKYLEFFEKRGHKIIPPALLVPENDSTTLFTSAGMQPLIPYLLGKIHPDGQRLVNSQPSFRTQDIEEVGDNRHTTFFEMLGNWSLGDYFKKEQLNWFFEFLTNKTAGLGLDPQKIYVTVFTGNESVPKDEESIAIWKEIFNKEGINAQEGERIFTYGVEKNWWSRSGTPEKMPVGEIGGPDSEIFYEFSQIEHNQKFGEKCHPNCDCGRFLEIGNSVFIQYQKQEDGSLKELPNKNVDFGGGLERQAAVTNNEPDIFKIDLFWPVLEKLQIASNKKYTECPKEMRIIADHLKASVFLIASGIEPSNKDRGYILRRLIRRTTLQFKKLGIFPLEKAGKEICEVFITLMSFSYPELEKNQPKILETVEGEIKKFTQTLDRGLKEFNKLSEISGKTAFDLFQTYGFPLELTEELALEKGQNIDKEEFRKEFIKHQELSRTASAGMFKGGLADHSEIAIKYHTATHLLHAALRQILGTRVEQKGSNITDERLRFDFSHFEKLTENQLKEVEDLVNEKIKEALLITSEVMDKDAALKSGALGFFTEKYGDKVTVYTIGAPSTGSGSPFSREICGGPHVKNTEELGQFKIIKEESLGANLRRIYAKLE